jgi:hypothetical protein
MAPNGNIYWPGACSNLITCDGGAHAADFIHEMTHVWQRSQGINVRLNRAWLQIREWMNSGFDPYYVDVANFDYSRSIRSYNMEQQGTIAALIYTGTLTINIFR